MTKEFDKRNMAKSRRVCEDMDAAHVTKWLKLTERERQILAMWPRFEDGEPVMVEVTAKYCDSELTFDTPAKRAPRIGDIVTVAMEWGEDE